MKRKATVIFKSIFILIFFSCKSQKNSSIIPFVETYINSIKTNPILDDKENLLIVGTNKNESDKNYWVYVYAINPKYMSGFKYSKIYLLTGYRIIIDESLNSLFIENSFKNLKKIPFKNFNLAKYQYSYNPNMWRIVFNDKNEILEIFPQEKSDEIKTILENKGLKFSKNYIE